MATTQGRRTLALTHAGGAVREIDNSTVEQALVANDLPHNPEIVARITQLLCDRLVSVDAAPKIARGSEKQIDRIEKAAAELLAAMKDMPDMGDLILSVKSDLFRIAGHMKTDAYLRHWLICMSGARERYYEEYNPTGSYHRAIFKIRGMIGEAGGNVAVHENSRLVGFLCAMEAERPAMIFAPQTTNTSRGRYRYIERAIAACSPQQGDKSA